MEKKHKRSDSLDDNTYNGDKGIEVLKLVLLVELAQNVLDTPLDYAVICKSISRYIFTRLIERVNKVLEVEARDCEPEIQFGSLFFPRPTMLRYHVKGLLCYTVNLLGRSGYKTRFHLTMVDNQGQILLYARLDRDHDAISRVCAVPGSRVRITTQVTVDDQGHWKRIQVYAHHLDWKVYSCNVCGQLPNKWLMLKWVCDECLKL